MLYLPLFTGMLEHATCFLVMSTPSSSSSRETTWSSSVCPGPPSSMQQALVLHLCAPRAEQRSLPAWRSLFFTWSLLLAQKAVTVWFKSTLHGSCWKAQGPNEECNAASSVSSCFLPCACQQIWARKPRMHVYRGTHVTMLSFILSSLASQVRSRRQGCQQGLHGVRSGRGLGAKGSGRGSSSWLPWGFEVSCLETRHDGLQQQVVSSGDRISQLLCLWAQPLWVSLV